MRQLPPILSRDQSAAEDLMLAIRASVAAKITLDASDHTDGFYDRREAEYVASLDAIVAAFNAMKWATE